MGAVADGYSNDGHRASGAPSVFTAAGQAYLRGAARRSRDESERLVAACVTRVNQHGCGLSFLMDGQPPEGTVRFWFASNPEIRLSGRMSGGIVVMYGQDWATRQDMAGLVRTVVRDLTLARENPAYVRGGLTRGADGPNKATDGERPAIQRGFVREITLAP